ncbi:MAG: chorismate mutase [Gaiellaceae bacterium]|jgi:chorismate mutase
MSGNAADPILNSLREEIAAADRDLISAFARRLRVAARIKSHKADQGYELIDPEREQRLFETWRQANDGTISDQALRELFEVVLALSKRETSADSRPA